MSTSSISSAASNTLSGMRSRTGAPVMVPTTSATDSRCWTLQVLMTWIPASRMSSTSSQRFSRGEPGAFECASSSMSATVGRRVMTASGVQLLDHDAPVLDAAAGHDLQALEECGGPQAAVGLHEPDHHVRAPVVPPVTLFQHPVRLSDTGCHAQVDTEPPPARRCRGRGVLAEPGEQLVRIRTGVEQISFGHVRTRSFN